MGRTFIAKVDELQEALRWIKEGISSMQFGPSLIHQIELACEEVMVNLIRHAYKEEPKEFEITLHSYPQSHIEITFKDFGPPFDPLTYRPDFQGIGGLGIHLMRECMDEVLYKRENETNILTLIKKV